MQPRKPLRQQMIPARDHGQPSADGEESAEGRQIINEQEQDREGHHDSAYAQAFESGTQRLRDGSNDILGIRRDESQDSAGGENVNQRNNWRSNPHRTRQMACGISAFTGEYRDILESGQGP